MTHVQRHIIATAFMLLGGSAVFGVVYVMNAAAPPPPEPPAASSTDFRVEREPPKPKSKPAPRQHKRAQPTAQHASAPAPNLASQIAGPSFDLPQFESADLGDLSERVIGETQTSNQVFTADAVDSKPKALSQAQPEYPNRARQRGITGYVKLNLLINPEGEVESTKVLESSPQGVFDDSAIAAVQRWRFEAPRYNGEPVKMWFKQTVKFQLN